MVYVVHKILFCLIIIESSYSLGYESVRKYCHVLCDGLFNYLLLPLFILCIYSLIYFNVTIDYEISHLILLRSL